MAIVYKGGKRIRVKNLGWLLKHWREVEEFIVVPGIDGNAAWMIAKLIGGGDYSCGWASKTLLRMWLTRPVFRGVKLTWFGTETEC